MKAPEKCAALLKIHLSDVVQCARCHGKEETNWEVHPHSFFYSIEGEYQKNILKKAIKIINQ